MRAPCMMDSISVSPEQWYTWDVSGYLVVRACLTSAQCSADEALSEVPTSPKLMAALDLLFGEPEGESQQVGYVLPAKEHNFRLQSRPELLMSGHGGAFSDARGLGHRRTCYNDRLVNTPFPDERGLPRGIVVGVSVVVVVSCGVSPADAALCVVPASHNTQVSTLPSLDVLHEAGSRLQLSPGDALLTPSNLIRFGTDGGGAPMQAVALEVVHHSIKPVNGYEVQPMPAWMHELSAEQQALIGGREHGRIGPTIAAALHPAPTVPKPDSCRSVTPLC